MGNPKQAWKVPLHKPSTGKCARLYSPCQPILCRLLRENKKLWYKLYKRSVKKQNKNKQQQNWGCGHAKREQNAMVTKTTNLTDILYLKVLTTWQKQKQCFRNDDLGTKNTTSKKLDYQGNENCYLLQWWTVSLPRVSTEATNEDFVLSTVDPLLEAQVCRISFLLKLLPCSAARACMCRLLLRPRLRYRSKSLGRKWTVCRPCLRLQTHRKR